MPIRRRKMVARRRPGLRRRRYNIPRSLMLTKRKKFNFLTTKRTFHLEAEEFPATTRDIWYDVVGGGIWHNASGVSHVFRLSDLPAYTEFTKLFDSYRIKGVKLEFEPVWNSGNTDGPTPFATAIDRMGLPMLTYAIDTDGPNVAPTSEDEILQYATNKRILISGKRTIYIRNPRCELVAGNYSAAEAKAGQWLDCSALDIEHYGLKYWMPTQNVSKAVFVRVYMTYYLQFKRVI